MLQIKVTNKDKSICFYQQNNIPYANSELEQMTLLRYHTIRCDRCKKAVLEHGFGKLVMEIEQGKISADTLRLFSVLNGYTQLALCESKIEEE